MEMSTWRGGVHKKTRRKFRRQSQNANINAMTNISVIQNKLQRCTFPAWLSEANERMKEEKQRTNKRQRKLGQNLNRTDGDICMAKRTLCVLTAHNHALIWPSITSIIIKSFKINLDKLFALYGKSLSTEQQSLCASLFCLLLFIRSTSFIEVNTIESSNNQILCVHQSETGYYTRFAWNPWNQHCSVYSMISILCGREDALAGFRLRTFFLLDLLGLGCLASEHKSLHFFFFKTCCCPAKWKQTGSRTK